MKLCSDEPHPYRTPQTVSSLKTPGKANGQQPIKSICILLNDEPCQLRDKSCFWNPDIDVKGGSWFDSLPFPNMVQSQAMSDVSAIISAFSKKLHKMNYTNCWKKRTFYVFLDNLFIFAFVVLPLTAHEVCLLIDLYLVVTFFMSTLLYTLWSFSHRHLWIAPFSIGSLARAILGNFPTTIKSSSQHNQANFPSDSYSQ